jgi:SPP1 gp7 family putative phage head morphogenesis protein
MDKKQVASKMKALSKKELSAAQGFIKNYGSQVGKRTLAGMVKSVSPKLEKKWQIDRVIRTEQTRNAAQAAEKQAAKEGVKRVTVTAQGDACPICRAKAGSQKTGGEAPPFHPNCRCSVSH